MGPIDGYGQRLAGRTSTGPEIERGKRTDNRQLSTREWERETQRGRSFIVVQPE